MDTRSNNTRNLIDFLTELEKAQKGDQEYEVEKWYEPSEFWQLWDELGPFNTTMTYRVKYVPKTYWLNMYPNGAIVTYRTKEKADERAGTDRVACVEVEEK